MSFGNILNNFLLGAVGSALGGSMDYESSLALQKQNQGWMERMSNTAHQREVEDLKAAGLNPILSANQGANAYSSGLNNSGVPDVASSAMAYNQMENTTKQTNSNVNLQTAQAQNYEAMTETEKTVQRKNIADAIGQEAENPYISQKNKATLKKIATEITNLNANTALATAKKDAVGSEVALNNAMQVKNYAEAKFNNERARGYSESESFTRNPETESGNMGFASFRYGKSNTSGGFSRSRSKTY